MKKIAIIFVLALVMNWAWENLHAPLYLDYQGGEITQLILLRAAFFDALVVTALGVLVLKFGRMSWAIIAAIIFTITLERWALATGRWAYGDLMPIVPLLNVGLSPMLQLAVTAYLSLILVSRLKR